MTRLIICMIPVALTFACSGDTTAPDSSFLRGVITSRAPQLYGVQDESGGVRIDSVPAMFVKGGGSCDRQAFLSIGSQTEVFRQVEGELVRADTGQLVLGRRITVWIDGVVQASCPPQASAGRVLLEVGR
jgi:hypothetical protein